MFCCKKGKRTIIYCKWLNKFFSKINKTRLEGKVSILNAILYTVLLVVFWIIIQLILIYPLTFLDQLQDYSIRFFGIIRIVSVLGSFVLFYFFFWNPKPVFNFSSFLKRKNYSTTTFFLLPVVAIGLFFTSRPLWDFKLILDFHNDISLAERPILMIDQEAMFFEIISVLLVAPIVEELFYRKFLLEKLAENYSIIISLIVSSFCFSIIHIETPNNLFPAFISGIVLGIIFLKTRKIAYSITLHFLFNLLILTTNKINVSNDNWFIGYNFDFIYWLLFCFGILLTIFGTKKVISS